MLLLTTGMLGVAKTNEDIVRAIREKGGRILMYD
jgi:hypothetical protein